MAKKSIGSGSVFDDFDWLDKGKGYKPGAKTGGYAAYKSCYETHPALVLPNTDLQIFGGSCLTPFVKDADVYIGFDGGMRLGSRSFPWEPGHEFLFKISDMQAPSSAADFKKLVDWALEQLRDGRKVHAGCIGGHGRTGTFFAALVAACGEPDAIAYVRKNYCHKAVESSSQIDFLVKHFGVKKAAGSKSHHGGKSSKGSGSTLSISSAVRPGKIYAPLKGAHTVWRATS